MPKLPDSILNGKIIPDPEGASSGDGKRMFLVASTNDGWEDLRIEIDTDDCDSKHAKLWAKRIMECVNICTGIEDPKQAINPS